MATIRSRLGLVLMTLVTLGAACSHDVEEVMVSDFHALVDNLVTEGHRETVFAIARSDHPDAIKVLLAVEKTRSGSRIAVNLDRPHSIFNHHIIDISAEDLEIALAVAGHKPSWQKTVAPLLSDDPCVPAPGKDQAFRRLEFMNQIAGGHSDKAITFLASLLWVDDGRPWIYSFESNCYLTAARAANLLERIAKGDEREPERPSKPAAHHKVREMKDWWESHAHEYGVEDPQEPFAHPKTDADLALARAIEAIASTRSETGARSGEND